jgi:hypothetical protein
LITFLSVALFAFVIATIALAAEKNGLSSELSECRNELKPTVAPTTTLKPPEESGTTTLKPPEESGTTTEKPSEQPVTTTEKPSEQPVTTTEKPSEKSILKELVKQLI